MQPKLATGIVTIALCVIGLAVTGCASNIGGSGRAGASTGPASAGLSLAPNANPQPTDAPVTKLTAAVSYPAAGITLDVPVASQTAAAAALSTCNDGRSPCDPGVPTVSLTSLSDSQLGTAMSGASVSPTYTHALVWAMAWHHADCSVLGPSSKPSPSKPSAAASSLTNGCDHVVFVDARTGKYLFSYAGPPATG